MSARGEAAHELPVTSAEWSAFFSRYADIVFVANSDQVDIESLAQTFQPRTLFVFFNKTYKVLSRPFARPALLVARSSPAGANIVYRREVAKVVEPFVDSAFAGILNLRAGEAERFSAKDDFEGRAVGFLDLAGLCASFYPATRVPTSGFALAVWLAEQRVPTLNIHLAGFTARRSVRWKLFKDHDWTFEQTALRLLHRADRLTILKRDRNPSALVRFAERFPEIEPNAVFGEAADVLNERLANTEAEVDRLVSLTRFQAKLRAFFQSIKPRTRKARLADQQSGASESTNTLAKSVGSD